MLWINSDKEGIEKLYSLVDNRLLDIDQALMDYDIFVSMKAAFKLSSPQKSLTYYYEEFKYRKEIVNHSCVDFDFKDNGLVLCLIEQNNAFKINLYQI